MKTKGALIAIGLIAGLSCTIVPTGARPISATISNIDEIADYEFRFELGEAVPEGGVLEIEFPPQYQENLGVYLWTSCTFECTLIGHLVTLALPDGLDDGVVHTVTVKGIRNPRSIGKMTRRNRQLCHTH